MSMSKDKHQGPGVASARYDRWALGLGVVSFVCGCGVAWGWLLPGIEFLWALIVLPRCPLAWMVLIACGGILGLVAVGLGITSYVKALRMNSNTTIGIILGGLAASSAGQWWWWVLTLNVPLDDIPFPPID